MRTNIDMANLRIVGTVECIGGKHPDPPLDDFPLLAWSGGPVHTEDRAATVEDIARAMTTEPDFAALAERFGTTEDHVWQAVHYAIRAGFVGE